MNSLHPVQTAYGSQVLIPFTSTFVLIPIFVLSFNVFLLLQAFSLLKPMSGLKHILGTLYASQLFSVIYMEINACKSSFNSVLYYKYQQGYFSRLVCQLLKIYRFLLVKREELQALGTEVKFCLQLERSDRIQGGCVKPVHRMRDITLTTSKIRLFMFPEYITLAYLLRINKSVN